MVNGFLKISNLFSNIIVNKSPGKNSYQMNEFEILTQIKEEYADVFDGYYPFPVPFRGKQTIKAILLGTDPGNVSSGSTVRIPVVFGLLTPDSLYFRAMKENMDQVKGLELDNLYIQNVCRSYFTCDTSKNKHWKAIAKELWIPHLKQELDFLFDPDIPVLVTAEIILDVILKDKKPDAEDIYKNTIIFGKDQNHLIRTVLAFYRHTKYALTNWPEYTNELNRFFTG